MVKLIQMQKFYLFYNFISFLIWYMRWETVWCHSILQTPTLNNMVLQPWRVSRLRVWSYVGQVYVNAICQYPIKPRGSEWSDEVNFMTRRSVWSDTQLPSLAKSTDWVQILIHVLHQQSLHSSHTIAVKLIDWLKRNVESWFMMENMAVSFRPFRVQVAHMSGKPPDYPQPKSRRFD